MSQGGSAGVAYLIGVPPFKKGEAPAYRDLYALQLSNGRVLWRQRFGLQDSFFPLAGEGVLYLGSGSEQSGGQGRIAALRASDGRVIWRSALQAGAVLPLVASGDTVFVEAISPATDAVPPYQPRAIEALRASDGALLWKVPETAGVWATLGNGVLYLSLTPILQGATPSQTPYLLVALDTSTGKLLWQLTLPRPQSYYQAPLLSNGVLYMTPQQTTLQGATPGTALLAVRASNGQVLWQARTPGLVRAGSVVVADGAVCYLAWSPSSPASGIVALHTQDGSLSWQLFSQASQPGLLLSSGGVLYAFSEIQTTSYEERLDAYAMSDGAHLSRIPLPSGGLSLAQMSNGVFYGVVDPPNATAEVVVSLKASDGSLNWRYQITGEQVQSLLMAA